MAILHKGYPEMSINMPKGKPGLIVSSLQPKYKANMLRMLPAMASKNVISD